MKKQTERDRIDFPEQVIKDIEMNKEVKKSFIEYSMSVIIDRALPDIRDGMKPGQRRILYAMYEDHLTHDKPFRKSATTVGNVLGRYHPHGDSSVYGTMVHMAQDFSMRYPLVEGHGNFGSVDGDPPAAYRYTEARMEKIADEMMRDLDKNGVKMTRNFDNRLDEPTVLPARFPNFLVNGSMGIAVGMATNVPPHNLGEVIDATIYRMENPACSIDDLMQFIQGPDFPTGATIYGVNGIKETYRTGEGRITVRSKAVVEEENHRIIFTEIPYGVNKSMLCEAIADCVKDKKIEGIVDLRDESSRAGMRIVVDIRRDANSQVILNQLYRHTQLQDTCAAKMLAIVNNEPKVLNLSQVLDYYIAHQKEVILRRTQFDLDKALARLHILEGYQIAIDNIDEVVHVMKTAPSIPEAKATLMAKFGLSDVQSQAIVDMTLGKLTGLETKKVQDEMDKLHVTIDDLQGILHSAERVIQVIKEEMLAIKEKYGDPRRTEIVQAEDDIQLEDLIEKHNCIITLTHAGYIKRQATETYSSQKRGGKGVIGMTTKEEDFIEKVVGVHSHSDLMLFTNRGRVQVMRAYQVPEASRTAKGSNLVNLLMLGEGEKVTAMISVNEYAEDRYLTMVTRRGIIKRTKLSEYAYQRKGGKIAIDLDEGDELLFVLCTDGERNLFLATRNGNAIRFDEANIRCVGRTARGVRGITLKDDDTVVGTAMTEEGKKLVTITEGGFGKRTEFDDFREMKNRGGMGVICHHVTEKTGKLAGISTVADDEDLMLITSFGTIIRVPVSDIPIYSRSASGVIAMRLDENQSIVNFTKVPKEEEKSEDGAEETESGEEILSDAEAIEVEAPAENQEV